MYRTRAAARAAAFARCLGSLSKLESFIGFLCIIVEFLFSFLRQSMLPRSPFLNNYHKEGTVDAAYQHWVLLEVKE